VRLAWSRDANADWRAWPGRCRRKQRDLLIGPRVRLWQAKDVPETVVLELLRRKPGTWWSIDNAWGGGPGGDGMPGMVQHAPELADFPWAVINAKLDSMRRRGLVDGCSCGCRGDWHVYGEDEKKYWEWVARSKRVQPAKPAKEVPRVAPASTT
jgi:hypothetical protein